jgi:hypothetical protein
MTLRASGGTGASINFYSDTTGNLTTALGSGTTLESWLLAQGGLTAYAFVSVWFDQSVTCSNNATQVTLTSQPIYDVVLKIINFGYVGSSGGVVSPQSNSYFNLPNETVPNGNSSYTVIMKHLHSSNITNGGWLGSNRDTAGVNMFRFNTTNYRNWWGGGKDVLAGTYADGNIVTFKYDNVTTGTTVYVNSIASPVQNRTAHSTGTTYDCYIGVNYLPYNDYLNGQLYYLYIFSTPLNDADRGAIEATTFT